MVDQVVTKLHSASK